MSIRVNPNPTPESQLPNNPATGMWQKIIWSYDLWGAAT